MKYLKTTKREMGTYITEEGFVKPYTVLKSEGDDFTFEIGAPIKFYGYSKGRGFAGGMKRYGFHGGPATHGQSDRKRAIGSIGQQTPGRVFKGKKMPGHMGIRRVTVQGSFVLEISVDKKEMKVLGPVPGARNSKVYILI